jgi:hypothetical protein
LAHRPRQGAVCVGFVRGIGTAECDERPSGFSNAHQGPAQILNSQGYEGHRSVSLASMIGGDPKGRSGRGYAEGQFRGERWLYGEMEYRLTLTSNGLLGMVLFANATTVSNPQADQQLFDAVEPAAGTGLRFLLFKRSRTNLCLDFGWGRNGSHGVYLGVGEAF